MTALVPALLCLLAQDRSAPLAPADELARFDLAPGLVAELVASEPDAPKVVDIAFDDSARMWAITATEYPYDGNERADAADKYRSGGRDRVLVFDDVWSQPPRAPRVFADGLFQPMAILPWRDGALVGHGSELLFLRDNDGDGRADAREVWLSGFGIEDSHLLPHRLLRGPGGWIYVAQGAFNYSKVKGNDGRETRFDLCKLARFREGGRDFEIVCWGPNNIWGFVLDARGQMWIQEANDLGMPLMPLFHGAAYKGIGDDKPHTHAPWQPELAEFQMGGTGLSGLAELGSPFSGALDGVFAVANPILNAVQSIRVHDERGIWRLERGPDLLVSRDPWFRPIAVHNGPDGCLYIVDWYNEIISHNEVPRGDPRRDKQRGRIWRMRPSERAPARPRDVTRAPLAELPGQLRDGTRFEKRAAWRQIATRGAPELEPALRALAVATEPELETRLLASWSLDAIGADLGGVAKACAMSDQPALRVEAARLCERHSEDSLFGLARALLRDSNPRVRLAALRAFAAHSTLEPADVALIAEVGAHAAASREPLPLGRYREFEASQARALLERHAARLASGTVEQRAFAALALPAAESALALAALLPQLGRAPRAEELDRVLQAAWSGAQPATESVNALLASSDTRTLLVERALAAREVPQPLPNESAWVDAARAADASLRLRLARKLRLSALGTELSALAWVEPPGSARRAELLRTLAELGAAAPELCARYAFDALPGEALQREALQTLAALPNSEARASALVECASRLPEPLARIALDALIQYGAGRRHLLEALDADRVNTAWITPEHVERLQTYDSQAPVLAKLAAELERDATAVLRLSGGKDERLDSDVVLDGPFTVAAWVRLDEPITNADGILGRAGGADFNFADGRARLYAGPGEGDLVIAKRALEPGRWTHVAFTRDAAGLARVFLDGELSATGTKTSTSRFDGLDVGATTPEEGTRGELAHFLVLGRALDEAEIAQAMAVASPQGWPGFPIGGARVERTLSGPPVATPQRAAELQREWDKYAAMLRGGGDAVAGRGVFARTCESCHAVGGTGGRLGPPLDGSGLRTPDGLLAALLYPSRAVEGGYRQWRIKLASGEELAALVVQQDERGLLLRRAGMDDLFVPRGEIAAAEITRLSAMPDGQLQSLPDADAAALLAYLASLR
ncbi:MAG: c-type cytochrome [Planctomycetes bacterium]|nr:c-type cytochrome [Planctomycetota bacterium]